MIIPYKDKHNGFTLIELLIVIAIIGILSVIIVPNFQSLRLRAHITIMFTEHHALLNGMKAYHFDYGTYPKRIDAFESREQFRPLTTPIAYISHVPADLLAIHYWGQGGNFWIGWDPYRPTHNRAGSAGYLYSYPAPDWDFDQWRKLQGEDQGGDCFFPCFSTSVPGNYESDYKWPRE